MFGFVRVATAVELLLCTMISDTTKNRSLEKCAAPQQYEYDSSIDIMVELAQFIGAQRRTAGIELRVEISSAGDRIIEKRQFSRLVSVPACYRTVSIGWLLHYCFICSCYVGTW